MIGGFYMVVIYIYNWITLLIGLEDFSQGFSSKNHFIIYFMNKSWLDRQECFYVSAMFEHHGDKRQNHEKNMRADNQQGNVLGFNRQTYGASGCLRSGFSVGEFGSGVPKLMDKQRHPVVDDHELDWVRILKQPWRLGIPHVFLNRPGRSRDSWSIRSEFFFALFRRLDEVVLTWGLSIANYMPWYGFLMFLW